MRLGLQDSRAPGWGEREAGKKGGRKGSHRELGRSEQPWGAMLLLLGKQVGPAGADVKAGAVRIWDIQEG